MKYEQDAVDFNRGMTLTELRNYVAQLDALGVDGDTNVFATVVSSFGGVVNRLQRLRVVVPDDKGE